jgi:hypothetical protein
MSEAPRYYGGAVSTVTEWKCSDHDQTLFDCYKNNRGQVWHMKRYGVHPDLPSKPIVMYQSAGQPYPIHYKAIWNWGKIVAIVKIYPKNNKA